MDGRAKETFLQRRHTDGQKHMKRCSASLNSREIQTNTTMTITSYQSEWKNLQIINPGEDVKKREPSCTVDKKVK